ncbi:hypothetical protein [Paenibacillus lactis]|uniref:hypothetical protein n=1 Tax=Paenibacillus lactis TaxID=228574 RepID=UPI003D72DC1A
MSLETFYIDRIQQLKKGNMDVYEQVLKEVRGAMATWEAVKYASRDKQIEIYYKLDDAIKLKNSPIDIKKLSYAIQHSRSGVGGCAMTDFECKFCGKEEMWGNTNTPGICKECATEMARNITKYNYDILKGE